VAPTLDRIESLSDADVRPGRRCRTSASSSRKMTELERTVTILVELHGGTVMAESGGRGGGSTFRIVLPAAAATPSAQRPRQSA
jgi:hypothetical protein